MSPRAHDEHEALVSSRGRFIGGEDRGLRSRTARGTIINSLFQLGTNGLTLVQGIAVAALLPPSVYGLWGLLLAAFVTLLMLGNVGIEDKFIQQDEPDQQRAFEVAFTFQVMLGAVFAVVLLLGMPTFALAYGRPELVGPGIALALAIPALVMQMPLWVHYRRMDFVRQRTLQAIDPVVTLIVTLALAVAGLGLWALVVGALSGTWVAALVIMRTSPYRFRLHWDQAAFREYRRFSVPLFVSALSTAILIQAPVIVASRFVGIAAVAAIALATNIAQFTTRVDSVITQTLYPAICAVKDDPALLFESFWKSNRLALLWAVPLGCAAPLFVGDFVHYVIGERWRFAVPLVGLYGINAAINQIGFNWSAFYRAIGDTRPMAVAGVAGVITVVAIPVPLLAIYGLTGFGTGMVLVTLISLGLRFWYLSRIFPSLALLKHTVAGLAPTLPAIASVLVLRELQPASRTLARVALESGLYALIAFAATLLSQRRLLRESVGYLRGSRVVAASA